MKTSVQYINFRAKYREAIIEVIETRDGTKLEEAGR